MPIFGAGLHFLLAILCAVHAVRTGRPLYWLLILFLFPVLGSVVYFVAVWLPTTRLQRHARKAVSAAGRAIDPQREVRAAREALAEMPTAQNQLRLATALFEAGDAAAAAQAYEACLQGPFAKDLEIRFGAARAYVECARDADALRHLEDLRRERPEFRADQVSVLRARALAGLGRTQEAGAEFAAAEQRFGTYEAKAEYAIWAYDTGDRATSARLQEELDRIETRWNALARELNAPVQRRLRAARERAA